MASISTDGTIWKERVKEEVKAGTERGSEGGRSRWKKKKGFLKVGDIGERME